MGFKECIQANIDKGLVDKVEGESLLKDFDALSMHNSVSKTIDKISDKYMKRQLMEQMNTYKHLQKRSEILGELSSRKNLGDKAKYVSEKLQVSRDSGTVYYENFHRVLNEFVGDFDHDISPQLMREVYKSIIDGTDASNPTAKQLADGLKKMFGHIKNESDIKGLVMGDLGERFTPRFYEKSKVRMATDDEFIAAARKHMIIDKDMSDMQFNEMVLDGKKDIETDGLHSKSKESKLDEDLEEGDTPFAYKQNQSRKWKFKSSEDYLEFNKVFGKGDEGLAQNIFRYMHSISHDLGIIDTLGPNPNGIMDEALEHVELARRNNKSLTGVKNKLKNQVDNASVGTLKAEFNTLTSTAFTGDTEDGLYKAFQASQNILRAAHLGSATISALSDPAIGAISQKMTGGSASRLFADYFGLMKGLVGQKSFAKKLADEMGYLGDTFNGMMVGDTRLTLGGEGKGVSKKLADATFKLSGLDAWTKNGRILGKINTNQNIATQISNKVSWDKLHEGLRANFERVGINEQSWQKVLDNAKTFVRNGRTFLNTNELRISKDIGFKEASTIANQIDSLIENVKNLSINENNLTVDAITTGAAFGGGEVSRGGKMAANAIFQYKTFALSIMLNHTIPAIKRASGGGLRQLDHLAMLALGTGMFAAIPLQMKEIVKGKSPKDMSDPEFWVASLAQGGGLGILGDFLFTDTSRYGRSLSDTMMGPYFGVLADGADITLAAARNELIGKGTKKDKARMKAKKQIFKFMKHNMPLNNLWYTRLMVERLLFDNIERLIDPKFDRKMQKYEKKMTKEWNQEYWWQPGKEPEIDKVAGR